jgi:hypothetical protein
MTSSKMPAAEKAKPKRSAARPPDDFLSVARRLECDEDRERFEASLGKIARAKIGDRGRETKQAVEEEDTPMGGKEEKTKEGEVEGA